MTEHVNDGGQAFPFKCQGPTTAPEFYCGMSLRDYFAAKAMQGLLASDVTAPEDRFAECSYKIADAMLRAREGVK